MRRPPRSTARLLLQLLMALSLLPYGVAVPPAHAAHNSPMPAGHEAHAGMMDTAHHAPMPDDQDADCCDATACDCGCVAPQSMLRQPETGMHAAVRSQAHATPHDPPRLTGPSGAPFRPPA